MSREIGGPEMAETTKFTIEGSMTLAYYADERHSKRVLIADEEDSHDSMVVGGNNQSLENKICDSVGFPNDAEFDEVFRKMEELRSKGLRTEEGVPDGTREIQLRITVEVL